MPNYKGSRLPNGKWTEDTPRRREQKRLAAARFRRKNRNNEQWLARSAEQKQAYRDSADPNKAREQKQERRFRFGGGDSFDETFFEVFHGTAMNRRDVEKPQFVVVYPDGRRCGNGCGQWRRLRGKWKAR
jgi:hypothetical protein